MLSSWGATVIMACRDTARGERAAKEMRTKSKTAGRIMVEHLDLASLKSVRAFARRIAAAGVPLNILVNNAGVRTDSFNKTDDGIELHYQVAEKRAVAARRRLLFRVHLPRSMQTAGPRSLTQRQPAARP